MKIKRYGFFSVSSFITVLCSFIFVLGLILFIFDITSIISSFDIPVKTFSSTANNKILYITSGNATDYATSIQLKGLIQEIDDLDYSFNIETLNSDNLNYRKGYDALAERIQKKVNTYGKFDAIVAADDVSLAFCLIKQEELFNDTPIFFVECLDPQIAVFSGQNEWITGSYADLPIVEIIKSALSINPNATKALAIIDSSLPGKACLRQFNSALVEFPFLKRQVLDFSKHTLYSFSNELNNISEDTIVIYFTASFDSVGNNFTTDEMAYVITSNLGNIPVYTPNLHFIEKDYFAGYVLDYAEGGKIIGRELHDVLLNTVDISDLNISLHSKPKFYVNYEKYIEYGLSTSKLPNDFIFVNYPLVFFNEYKQMIFHFFMVFVSLLIIVILLVGALKTTVLTKKKMEYEATHDILTGLYNRAQGIDFIAACQKQRKRFSILLIDIDDFKRINDFHSHLVGDRVLVELSSRIVKLMNEQEGMKACRFGGDEFGVLFEKHLDENSVEVLLLKNALNDCVSFDDIKIDVKVSIGIVNSEYSKTSDDLFTEVDLALNEAKSQGLSSNKSVFFTEKMKQTALKRNKISKKLEMACKKGEFAVYYQPQVNIHKGQIYGYEALIRLKDFSYSPGEFIPVAEECGYISRLGRIVTEEVISQMAKWKEQGKPLYSVAINFSSVQMGDVDYINFLQYLLEKYDVSPSLLEIEITESLFLEDRNYAIDLFNALRELGVKLALDDFGTGYSSLSYLTFLPVDKVKIDKSLVDNYLLDNVNGDFIKNLVNLVHGLGMKLTIEGIETRSQYEKLKLLNVDYVQGFYFSKPVSAQEIENFFVDPGLL